MFDHTLDNVLYPVLLRMLVTGRCQILVDGLFGHGPPPGVAFTLGFDSRHRSQASVESLGRAEVRALFGCAERDSIRLLHRFGATNSLPRTSLVERLEALRAGFRLRGLLAQATAGRQVFGDRPGRYRRAQPNYRRPG